MKTVYLPSNLDLDLLLKQSTPEFKYDKENFEYIIGTVIRLKSIYKKNAEETESEFVSLNSAILQSRIHDYRRYMKYLLEVGVLVCDNYYEPGKKSLGYKLADVYAEQEFIHHELKKFSLTRKVASDIEKERWLKRKYGYLIKWFDENLSIDADAAREYLQQLYERDTNAGDKRAKMKSQLRAMSIDRIERKDFDYTVDDTAERFHSNLTNLKSGLRNFITYNNEILCSIDVKNSQPFISTLLFNKEFYSQTKGGLNLYTLSKPIYKEVEPFISKILSLLSNFSSSIMLVKDDETQCGSDLELYCTLVDKGRLYPYLSRRFKEETGVNLDINKVEEKRRLKEIIFVTMFSDNRFIAQEEAKMKRFFKQLFPTVYEIFSLIKKKGNSLLPVILQRIESEIVLKRIAKNISKHHPKLPIFTIHDSIVTLVTSKELIRDIVKREFHTLIGLKPSLSVEVWTSDRYEMTLVEVE